MIPQGQDRDDRTGGSDVDTRPAVHLRLLATTDLHVQILSYDYYRDAPTEAMGLAALAPLIAAARAEVPATLLLDNGDFLQGNPMGDLAAAQEDGDGIHPMIAAMNALGYDAATPGNHEFNFGLDTLERALKDAQFPVVLANALRDFGPGTSGEATYFPPCVLLDRVVTDDGGGSHRIRIGIIGLVTPQIVVWDRDHLQDRLIARDIVECAAHWADRLRAQGADIIVALNHSGIGGADWLRGMEDAAIPLARHTDIDVQIMGHSHLLFPSPAFENRPDVDVAAGLVGGKPAVMAGVHGAHLGQIDLWLARQGGRWRIRDSRSRVLAAVGHGAGAVSTDETARMGQAVADWHRRTLDYIRRPVGVTQGRIHSFFAMVAPDPGLTLVAEAFTDQVRRAIVGTRWSGLPVIAAVPPFRAGGRHGPDHFVDIPAGPLQLSHISELYCFPNALCAVRLNGAAVREWLERAASVFCQIRPGVADQMLIHPDAPSYNFDVLHGLAYVIDLAAPARYTVDGAMADPGSRRIGSLMLAGQPLRPQDEVIIATNSYRRAGGGDFPGVRAAEVVVQYPGPGRDILQRHVQARQTVVPNATPVWSFASMPGASVLFDTSPASAGVLRTEGAPARLRIDPVALTEDGFLRLRLHL